MYQLQYKTLTKSQKHREREREKDHVDVNDKARTPYDKLTITFLLFSSLLFSSQSSHCSLSLSLPQLTQNAPFRNPQLNHHHLRSTDPSTHHRRNIPTNYSLSLFPFLSDSLSLRIQTLSFSFSEGDSVPLRPLLFLSWTLTTSSRFPLP